MAVGLDRAGAAARKRPDRLVIDKAADQITQRTIKDDGRVGAETVEAACTKLAAFPDRGRAGIGVGPGKTDDPVDHDIAGSRHVTLVGLERSVQDHSGIVQDIALNADTRYPLERACRDCRSARVGADAVQDERAGAGLQQGAASRNRASQGQGRASVRIEGAATTRGLERNGIRQRHRARSAQDTIVELQRAGADVGGAANRYGAALANRARAAAQRGCPGEARVVARQGDGGRAVADELHVGSGRTGHVTREGAALRAAGREQLVEGQERVVVQGVVPGDRGPRTDEAHDCPVVDRGAAGVAVGTGQRQDSAATFRE